MAVAFGVVMFAVALILIKIIVQIAAVSGDRPGLSHGAASVTFEAQSASLEVNLGEAHLVEEGHDIGITPVVSAPWPFNGDLAT